ncbi:MAG: tRNA pseudouridine synthase A [Lachnospiraceae bacterium]|nr:tRNA pseudouridine synthase A [Lachnospiraceae bacterium]
MKNYKITIEYDGGRYDGWQRAKGESDNTIERKIMEVLKKMTGEDIALNVGLRTEKGVHSYGQVANFVTKENYPCLDVLHYLNRYLPRDIAVTSVKEVPERFHASLNAKSKTYVYRLDCNEVPNVFERHYRYYVFKKLDVQAMEEACKMIEGRHDFAKFSSAKRNKSNEKTVFSAKVVDDGCEMEIHITANDFLHNMARFLFGCILEIGEHRMELGTLAKYFDPNSSEKPEVMADPCGMFLEQVSYEA